ncbi:PAS domain-containing protein [Pyruvatibacter sp.]|uniref:PAS domain-containing protein n=1 Tax=Pyruvatibacter sp. TaxID=1981328 RepID=UPI0032EDC3B2
MRIDVTHFQKPEHPDGKLLLAYYEHQLANGTLPRRRDMPAREILSILPNMFILEPANAPATDWRFRLMGQHLVTRFGADATGLCISQAYASDQVEHNAAVYRAVVNGERLSITRGIFEGIDREFLEMEIVHVPMLGSDDKTRWILGGLFFEGEHLSV